MCPWGQFNSPVSSNSPEATDKISCSRYLFVNSHILDVKMHSASSACKWCKGAAGHGRLHVFYIVQTNFVNAQGKSWTGEMDYRNRRVETHCNNAGVSRFATPFRDWTKFRTTDHCAECFLCYPYYRTHLFNKCVWIFIAILSPGGYNKIKTHKSSMCERILCWKRVIAWIFVQPQGM